MAERLVWLSACASFPVLRSQSSLLLPPQRLPNLGFPTRATPPAPLLPRLTLTCFSQKPVISTGAVTSSSASTIGNDNVDLASEGIEIGIEPDIGGGGYEDIGGGGGGEGGGRGGGDNEGEGGSSEESGGDSDNKKEGKKMGLSMSQKLTLGYAALVGIGGVMGYVKSGSQKSLLAGGISASVLYYVHTQLPTNPVYASSIGLGISATLLGVMGLRLKNSGKIFPAGVVSLVSLIMTGGYIHGILRSVH